MPKGQTEALMCRQSLFREQVGRFRRYQDRRPTLQEVRALWAETGFPTK